MRNRFLRVLLLLFLCTALWVGCKRPSTEPTKSSASPSETFAGNLEAVHNSQIIGWVWKRDQPDEAVSVTVLDGDKALATVQADTLRKDLQGKVGTGKHGFVMSTPQSLKDGKPHEIHAVVTGTQFELRNSPRTYEFVPKKPKTPSNEK